MPVVIIKKTRYLPGKVTACKIQEVQETMGSADKKTINPARRVGAEADGPDMSETISNSRFRENRCMPTAFSFLAATNPYPNCRGQVKVELERQRITTQGRATARVHGLRFEGFHSALYRTRHFLCLLPRVLRDSRAARVACSNTSRTPSLVLAEHSRYL